jgi:predicted nucleotidyltransferase
MIQLDKKHYAIIGQVLKSQIEQHKIYVFGSRAKSMARKFSDLDLFLDGEPLPYEELSKLKDAFSESDLPYFVDILQKHSLSDEMFESIKKDFVEIKLH